MKVSEINRQSGCIIVSTEHLDFGSILWTISWQHISPNCVLNCCPKTYVGSLEVHLSCLGT